MKIIDIVGLTVVLGVAVFIVWAWSTGFFEPDETIPPESSSPVSRTAPTAPPPVYAMDDASQAAIANAALRFAASS